MYSAQQHCLNMQWSYMQTSADLTIEHAGNADQLAYPSAEHAAEPEAVGHACRLCAAV